MRTGALGEQPAVAGGVAEASHLVSQIRRHLSALSSSPISGGVIVQVEFSVYRYDEVRYEPVIMTDTLKVMKHLVANAKFFEF